MKLIKPSFEIIEQEHKVNHKMDSTKLQDRQQLLDGVYKMIELAGRTCYRSEDKITPDSAKGFVDRMIKSGHGAVLEQGTVYLRIPTGIYSFLDNEFDDCNDIKDSFFSNPYTRIHCQDGYFYISTNYRVLIENFSEDFIPELLQYICEPTKYHEKRICVKYTSDIHFYKDCTRHRVFSWAIESTRFCNYIKSRFGSSVSFATPIWLKDEEQEEFEEDLRTIESIYFKWINKGWQPQQAAYFLIQGTKAEVIMTGFVSDYKHFFDLRSEIAKTGKPHPTVVELVEPLRQEFIKRGYINEN